MKLSYILKTDCYRNHNHQLQLTIAPEHYVRILKRKGEEVKCLLNLQVVVEVVNMLAITLKV